MTFLYLLIPALLGATIASFVGVLAERMHTGESWARGRSRCNSCARTLGPLDLVPVLSWLLAFGRCSACGSRIPVEYALSETTLALLYVAAAIKLGLGIPFALFAASVAVLLFIVLYDLRHMVVPLQASILFVSLAFLYAFLTEPSAYEFGRTLLVSGSIGSAFLLAFLASRGRIMGLGDAPIALGLSLLAGVMAFPGLIFSFWIGALCGILILVRARPGHRMGIEVPFVPFLAAGFLLAYFTQWTPFFLF